MRLRIIPIQLFLPAPNFVTVSINDEWQTVKDYALTNRQPDSILQKQFTYYPRHAGSHANKNESRAADTWKPFDKAIQKQFVIFG